MRESAKRINAIFVKELQDIKTNTNVIFMFFIPILFTLVYKYFMPSDMPDNYRNTFSIGFGLLFLAIMIGMYLPSMIIAEEKEKGTLEVLMLSPSSPIEIFAGKGLLTFVLMLVTMFVILFISGNGFANIGIILASSVLTFIVCIFIGMIVGILAPNQMSTGIIGLPIYLIFMMLPWLAMVNNNLKKISNVLPTAQYMKILDMTFTKNTGFVQILPHLGAIAGSILIVFAILLLVYNKKWMKD